MVRLRQACRRGALVASSSRIWTNLSPEDNDRKCRAPGQVLENIIMVSGVYKLRASCWGATNHTTYIQQWKGYDYDCQTSFSHERDPWKWRHVTRKAYCCCPLSYTRKGQGGGHSGWLALTNASLLDQEHTGGIIISRLDDIS